MSGGRIDPGPAPALLGVEIGRGRIRLALLNPEGTVVEDAIEAPIVGGDTDEATAEVSISGTIVAALNHMGIAPGSPLQVGVTIGFPHCGVGSGPALREWLVDLSRELREPVVHNGDRGISYAPIRCLDFIDRVFRSASLPLDRVELAPVAAARALGPLRSGSVTLGSGIAWSARIRDGEMMEAFEVIDGAVDEVLHLVANGTARPVEHLDGVFVDDGLCHSRGLSPASLAPAVGVALSLHDPPAPNLLDGRLIDATAPSPEIRPSIPQQRSHPPPRRPGPDAPVATEGPGPRSAAAPARLHHDDRASSRRRSSRAADPEPGNRLSTTDLLIGALLMLTVVLVIALVIP
ncbi:MAG: hypothetical protein OEY41_11030 [Acidimicrobiia bacterium]|nr:hypothetical protein [Acidimicrobiia bacterium]MDH5290519.1 hypothetical protein [Acidimicrobiia bacterium]